MEVRKVGAGPSASCGELSVSLTSILQCWQHDFGHTSPDRGSAGPIDTRGGTLAWRVLRSKRSGPIPACAASVRCSAAARRAGKIADPMTVLASLPMGSVRLAIAFVLLAASCASPAGPPPRHEPLPISLAAFQPAPPSSVFASATASCSTAVVPPPSATPPASVPPRAAPQGPLPAGLHFRFHNPYCDDCEFKPSVAVIRGTYSTAGEAERAARGVAPGPLPPGYPMIVHDEELGLSDDPFEESWSCSACSIPRPKRVRG